MKHLGDITKISGYDAPVVDVIIGGSPCQDLSVAGKRAGLAGERSGLYMEQIRIVKEMREADVLRGRTAEFIRPRYMVWENVPGAFSSNKGQDFAAVLEEAIRVAEPEAPSVSVPDKGWPTSGCLFDVDGRWSVAWRVLDAQFWGVPQRRRRIALVADFGGQSAPEILFVRKSMSGNIESCSQKRKEIAGDARNSTSTTVAGFAYKAGAKGGSIAYEDNKSVTLLGNKHDAEILIREPIPIHDQATRFSGKHGQKSDGKGNGLGIGDPGDPMNTLTSADRHAVACFLKQPLCIEMTSTHNTISENGISPTLTARMGTGGNQVNAVLDFCCSGGEVADTLDASYYKGAGARSGVERTYIVHAPIVAHSLKAKGNCDFREDSETYVVAGIDCRNCTEYQDLNGTMLASGHGVSMNCNQVIRVKHIVRRLIPLECERLQGYPDGWTDIGEWMDSKGKLHKEADSPKYKALGNSIAIPPWKWVLKRLCACYERDATMASLFDGIGGFPYIWEQLNGKGSCLWASEIEEFPMAVTKVRFGE